MLERAWRIRAALLLSALALSAAIVQAAPPSEQLFPYGTKGWVSIGNVQRFSTDWGQTQLGQMLADPAMQPFVDGCRKQLQKSRGEEYLPLGLLWDDLAAVASGEVAVGLVAVSETELARALVIDVAGREKQTAALLEKVGQAMTAAEVKPSQVQLAGSQVTFYELPAKEAEATVTALVQPGVNVVTTIQEGAARPERQVCVCLKDGCLLAADHRGTLADMLGRFQRKQHDSLAELPAFAKVIARCGAAAEGRAPHVRWFVEPIGYATALNAEAAAEEPADETAIPDLLHQAEDFGLEVVQGIGGFIHLAAGKYEIVHETAVYAPPVNPGAADRFEGPANALDFPNSDNLKLPAWVPRGVAACTCLNLHPRKIFEAIGPVFDANQPGLFEQTVQAIADDPDGPQVNLRDDLVALLGQQVTVATDYALPSTPRSKHWVVAIETTDPAQLNQNVARFMEHEADAKSSQHGAHRVWEIENSPEEIETVQPNGQILVVHVERRFGIETQSAEIRDAPAADDADEAAEEAGDADEPVVAGAPVMPPEQADVDFEDVSEHWLPSCAIAVAHGRLLVASDGDFLKRMLDDLTEQKRLGADPEFQRVAAGLDALAGGKACARSFRADQELRMLYQALRDDKSNEVGTIPGVLLSGLLSETASQMAMEEADVADVGEDGQIELASGEEPVADVAAADEPDDEVSDEMADQGDTAAPAVPPSIPPEMLVDGTQLPDFERIRRYLGPGGMTAVSLDDGWLIRGFVLRKETQADAVPSQP